MLIKVKVIPNAKKNEIVEWRQDVLRVKVASPPERGRANTCLIGFLAKEMAISKKNIEIISGLKTRVKIVKIDIFSEEDWQYFIKQYFGKLL